MAQREQFLSIDVISDDDTGMYQVGEIDTLPDSAIADYLKNFKEFGYTELTNWLIRTMAVTHNLMMKQRESEAPQAMQEVGFRS